MDGGSDGGYVSHLARHRLHRDFAGGRSVGPATEAEHTKPGGQTRAAKVHAREVPPPGGR